MLQNCRRVACWQSIGTIKSNPRNVQWLYLSIVRTACFQAPWPLDRFPWWLGDRCLTGQPSWYQDEAQSGSSNPETFSALQDQPVSFEPLFNSKPGCLSKITAKGRFVSERSVPLDFRSREHELIGLETATFASCSCPKVVRFHIRRIQSLLLSQCLIFENRKLWNCGVWTSKHRLHDNGLGVHRQILAVSRG